MINKEFSEESDEQRVHREMIERMEKMYSETHSIDKDLERKIKTGEIKGNRHAVTLVIMSVTKLCQLILTYGGSLFTSNSEKQEDLTTK
jgi:hypothetical protein